MKLREFTFKLHKLIAIIRNQRFRTALIGHRVAAGVEHRSILKHFDFNTVVDIGANRGQFAIVARECFPQAHVICFEPLPGPAKDWQSVLGADNHARLYKGAIGSEYGELEMHVSARDDSSSLLPISDLQSEIFPGTEAIATTKVLVAPLDHFIQSSDIKSPALLKLDVQGFEYQALLGCDALLSKFDTVYCECSFVELYSGQKLAADIVQHLYERGFQICGIFNPAYRHDGQPVQADFLFSKRQ